MCGLQTALLSRYILHMKKIILLLSVLFLCVQIHAQTAREVLEDMLTTIDEIQTSSFTLKMKERFGNQYLESKNDIKILEQPLSIYMKQYYPNDGIEIVWIEGQNSNKALINPNGFPYINISLSPYGSRMRKGNHHSMLTAGFKPPADILRHSINKVLGSNAPDEDYEKYLTLEETTMLGKNCYKVTLRQDDFQYEKYTLPKDMYLRDIANKNRVSEHMLMEVNGITHYSKVKTGTTILVPNYYAKTTIFYIDKYSMLPIRQEIYDDKGLYEDYEFTNIVINPQFAAKEFTLD